MTVLNILVYVALIGYVIFRRVQGHPVKQGRRLFVLPIVLIILGYGDVTSGVAMKPIEVTLTVIAGALSLGLGLLRGRADKLSERDGSTFVQWGAASLILFAANLVAKLVLDLIGVAAGSTTSAVGKSLLLTFGLTLLGEAVVIWMRTGGATGLLNSPRASATQPVQAQPDRQGGAVAAGDGPAVRSPSLPEAIGRHHAHHHDHHDHHRHDDRHERARS